MNGHFRPVPPRDPITEILEQLSRFSLRDAAWFHRPEFSGSSNVTEISRMFQAFLAPTLVVSARALLIAVNPCAAVGIVSRLRQYVHAKHAAAKSGRHAEADAYTAQIDSIAHRAELIRRCFMLALMSLAGTIAACLQLGLGLHWPQAARMAVVVFVIAMVSLFSAACYNLAEVNAALSSVCDDADARLMDMAVDMCESNHV